MFGRKWTALMLCLALMLPCAALAEENSIACMPGDTIDAVFQPVFPSGKPDVIVGQLEYDHDLFEGLFTGQMSVTPQGGVYMYNGNAVAVPFRVNRYAPAGTYTISVRVIEARDSQGKLMTDVTVLPVEVTVQKEKSVMPLPTAAPQPTASRPASPEKDFQYEIHDGKATVTGYSGNDAEVVIPGKLGGYPVEAIGRAAFYFKESLTSVIIPNGVKAIGSIAFDNCRNMTKIHIPNSVTSIGDMAFWWCTGLTEITIPDSVTAVDENPFCQCLGLKTIHISPNHPYLEIIDGVLFSKPDRRLIYYPQTLEAKSYEIPSETKIIGDSAFCMVWSLSNVKIPDSVTTIGKEAFLSMNFDTIILPEHVIVIGEGAFYSCEQLTEITIPDSVTVIGANPFKGCSKLEKIHVSETHPILEVMDGVLYCKTDKRLVCCLATLHKKSYTIPGGIQTIDDFAFNRCSELTSIIIPESVTSIGLYAFEGCSVLKSIHLPSQIKEINNGAFRYCSNLTDVNVPSSVERINWSAFLGCTSLRNLTIPNSVIWIDETAFSDCSPDLVITVSAGSYALDFCKQNGLKYQIK